jgi:hypothetical protein
MTSGKGQERQNKRGRTGLKDRAAGTGLPGLGSRERTAMTGQPEQDNQNGTIRTE